MNLHAAVVILSTILIVQTANAQHNASVVRLPMTTTVTSKINASWSWASPVFHHYYGGGYDYYYDIFKVVASVAGDYTFSSAAPVGTYGYLYLPSFNASAPDRNLITYGYPTGSQQQFQFTRNLDSGVSYYLVVTTSEFLAIGQYQAIVTGSARVTLTRTTVLEPSMPNVTVQSAFTHLQPQYEASCDVSGYFSYDIFSVVPEQNGTYTIETVFESSSIIRLYSPTFDPLASILNIVAINRNSRYRVENLVNVSLIASQRYYLVISLDYPYYTSAYRLTFRGAARFTLTKLTDSFVSTVKTSSSLSATSPHYSREYSDNYVYYYKVFRITVSQLGIYSLVGYSGVDILAYFYQNNFASALPYDNRFSSDYYTEPQGKFVLKGKLLTNTTYYLVVTTNSQSVNGTFNFTVAGPKAATVSAVADSSSSSVTLSVSLTSSRQFRRCQGYYENYYYKLFNISVPSAGLYTVKSVGSLDTFGCLYVNRFDPTQSSLNLLTYDDQHGDGDQFAITTTLSSNTVYYLAATTNREGSSGSFKVTISGPAKANMRAV